MNVSISKAVFLFFLCFISCTCTATVWTVTSATDMAPGSLRNIIYAASASDTLTFAIRGIVYIDSVVYCNKYLVILGPGADSLVYDGGFHDAILWISVNSYISGLGFAHGNNTGQHSANTNGGCVSLYGSTSTVLNCKFTTGMCNANGGGLAAPGYLTMSNCVFDNCSANNTNGSTGGAVYCHIALIRNCTFTNNVSNYYAGALSMCAGELDNCTFARNQTIWGGALSIADCNYNSAAPQIHTNSRISNCTFYHNAAYGGFYPTATSIHQVVHSDTSIYINNTFAADTLLAVPLSALFIDFYYRPSTASMYTGLVNFQNNLFANADKNFSYSTTANYQNYNTLGGNISSDTTLYFLHGPRDRQRTYALLDTAAGLGYHGGTVPTIGLLCSSPAVNGGIDAGAPVADARGYSRVSTTDAGSYEYQRLLPLLDSQAVTICAGDHFQIGHHSYSNTGTYLDTLYTTGGCDSTVITHLTVRAPILHMINFDTCAPYSVAVGLHSYSSSGTYMDTLSSIMSCDSVIQTVLNIHLPDTTVQQIDICTGDSLKVGYHTYYTAGTYTDLLYGRRGCDSTVISHLIVYDPIQSTAAVDLCYGDSFGVAHHFYHIAGIYEDTLATVHGCDSVIMTTITIKSPAAYSQSLAICYGDTVKIGGHSYTAQGVYTDVLTAVNGCDSTLTTSIIMTTINTQVSSTGAALNAIAATGKSYQWIACDNDNIPVPGATAQTFLPAHSGSYAVIEMQDGCTATSACHDVILSGIDDQSTANNVIIYPNPAHQYAVVKMKNAIGNGAVARLLDIYGRQLAMYVISGDSLTIDMSSYATGIYQLQVMCEEQVIAVRYVKD